MDSAERVAELETQLAECTRLRKVENRINAEQTARCRNAEAVAEKLRKKNGELGHEIKHVNRRCRILERKQPEDYLAERKRACKERGDAIRERNEERARANKAEARLKELEERRERELEDLIRMGRARP